MILPSTGFTPAPIMTSKPQRDIIATLVNPSQLRRPSVRGMATSKVAIENINNKRIAHRPLSERVDKACWPDSNSDPCDRIGKQFQVMVWWSIQYRRWRI